MGLDYDGGIVTEVDPSGGPSVIVLDRPYGNMRFVLAPPGTSAKLTAALALAAFKAGDPQFHRPSGLTAHLGCYTHSVDIGTYRYLHRLAWGYRWFECASSPGTPNGFRPSPLPFCTRWLFLDANTGEMLEAVFQH